MQVMNTQSSKKQSDLARLRFYVVPAAWMRKAWPVLSGHSVQNNGTVNVNWRQDIGQIECKDLVRSAHDHDGNGNGGSPVGQGHGQEEQKRKELMSELNKKVMNKHRGNNTTLRRGLKHEQDFFLLGSNAWLLIQEKFGSDQAIEKTCVFDPTLAVVLHNKESKSSQLTANGSHNGKPPQEQLELPAVHIPIPPTGRFRYEQYLDKPTTTKPTATTTTSTISYASITKPISYASITKNNHNRPVGLENGNTNGTHPGNVSDDDTAPVEQGDDLVSPVPSRPLQWLLMRIRYDTNTTETLDSHQMMTLTLFSLCTSLSYKVPKHGRRGSNVYGPARIRAHFITASTRLYEHGRKQ
jgi:hypothetical protein